MLELTPCFLQGLCSLYNEMNGIIHARMLTNTFAGLLVVAHVVIIHKSRGIKMKNLKIALTASITIALFSSTVLAGSNGSAPNGKPFVAIGGQIVEVKGAISSLQDQVNLLVVRADTMEGQVVNLQTAINTLRLEDANLLTLITGVSWILCKRGFV